MFPARFYTIEFFGCAGAKGGSFMGRWIFLVGSEREGGKGLRSGGMMELMVDE